MPMIFADQASLNPLQVALQGALAGLVPPSAVVPGPTSQALSQPQDLLPLLAQSTASDRDLIALGSGAYDLVRFLSAWQHLHWGFPATIPAPRVATALLVLPALPRDAFALPASSEPGRSFQAALEGVERLVVFCCPRDQGLASASIPNWAIKARATRPLGQCGPVRPCPERLVAIDISALIERPSRACEGFLDSYEALGLARSILAGVAVESALGAYARRMDEALL